MSETALSPRLTLLRDEMIESVIEEAFQVLEEVGVFVENKDAYALLKDHGAKDAGDYDRSRAVGRLYFPRDLVEKALETVPGEIEMWDIAGEKSLTLGADRVHFDPGSAALYLYDTTVRRIRKPVTADLIRFIRLVDKLPHYHLQSTALISADVPEGCGDAYRLFLALREGTKPVITGTFTKESFDLMREMLVQVRGGGKALREKPLAIFDACPSPPLMWSDLTADSVIKAAEAGIPSEFVSMPLTGSTAPVTLSGAVVQHAAETLCGVMIAQFAAPGAPVIWGGSPSAMDMRFGTTPMGAVETMMIDMADAAVGKSLGLPTHAYMGLSDAKRVDYQAGSESAMGIILATLSGINVVSGPGMLDFESCQSLAKLVLDHEVCGMAYRLAEGIARRDAVMALDLLKSLKPGGHLLTHPHTLKWFREEISLPGAAFDRRARSAASFDDLSTAEQRAAQEAERLISKEHRPAADEALRRELDKLMLHKLRKAGLDDLPKG